MKHSIHKLAMLCAMLYVSIQASAYSFVVEGIYYNILSDKTSVEVTYRNTNYDTYIGEITIPSEVSYNGKTYAVTAIGDHAFYKCSTVTSIKLPPSINKIGMYAFKDANHIQKVHISNLSAWCMINMYDSDSCPLIYGGTLYLNDSPVNSLESLDSSCTTIAKYAFWGNTYLTDVVLPESITSVQASAFKGCTNMRYLEVGANVTSMGEGAFRSCSSLKTIKFVDSKQTLKLGYYEYNKIYKYFKDCPLTKVYIGRKIEWAEPAAYAHDNYYPFTTIKSAIFNVTEASDYGFSDNLTTVYVGPTCQKFYIRSKNLADLFIFTNDITRAQLNGTKSNIYVIDKSNIPEKITALTYQNVKNLIDIKNLENGASHVYGNLPQVDSNNFENNVVDMKLNTSATSFESSVGYHDSGITTSLSNDLWDVSIVLPFSYTVTPAPLTIIANDASRKYGCENPELTCSFFGFKNGETKDVLTRLPNVETTATLTSNVGTYPIIPSGAEAKNYTFNYERGTLTVTKADQNIEWNQTLSMANVGDIVELTATSTSGLPVKYSVTDESIAEIFSQGGKKYIEFLKAGTVFIRANQEGNENYNEADRVSKSVTVSTNISGIILNQTSIDIKESDSYRLIATVIPNEASNSGLTWSSSDLSVATVDQNGFVTAVSKGCAIITVKSSVDSNISATCAINVIRPVTGINIESDKLILDKGETKKIQADAIPLDASNTVLAWSSSNKSIVTVDNGTINGIDYGTAIITVSTTDGSKISKTLEVTVSSPLGIGNTSTDDTVSVTARNGNIIISQKPENAIVRVFNMQGNIVAESDSNVVENIPQGLYIVNVGGLSFKVSLQ